MAFNLGLGLPWLPTGRSRSSARSRRWAPTKGAQASSTSQLGALSRTRPAAVAPCSTHGCLPAFLLLRHEICLIEGGKFDASRVEEHETYNTNNINRTAVADVLANGTWNRRRSWPGGESARGPSRWVFEIKRSAASCQASVGVKLLEGLLMCVAI